MSKKNRKPRPHAAWTGGMISRAMSFAGRWKGKPPLQLKPKLNWVNRDKSGN